MTETTSAGISASSPGGDLAATASTAYRSALEIVSSVEPRIADAIRSELTDQRSSLKLIASENYASLPVLMTCLLYTSDAADE